MGSEDSANMYDKKHLGKKSPDKPKFLSLSLFLLLQGEFISVMGNMIYEIGLGFWVLAFTGSTAIMGTLMAVSLVPSVLLSPFAGVIADRSNRKKLMVSMDIIRGITIIIVAIAAYFQILQLWEVFIAGIILGVCGAFFNPAAISILPKMVPKEKLTNTNSLFGIANTGADIIGNSIGGIAYVVIGAPLMFLFNGLSFITSGILTNFAKIPKNIESEITSKNFISDLKESLTFIKNLKGLSSILLIFSITSFLEHMTIVLLIPLFQTSPGLGPAKYGISMASFTMGMLLSMIILSVVNLESSRKVPLMFTCLCLSNLCFIAFALTNEFYVMITLLFLAGIAESVIAVFIMSSLQSVVPDNMMGKFMGIVEMLIMSLTPLAMVTGGFLAEFFPIKTIFLVCFTASFLVSINLFFIPSFRKFITFDPETQNITDLMS